jgi:phenylacetate-CoA ligase
MGLLLPTWVSVAGELCTPPVREAVRSARGIEASEFWGCSEGTYAFPCGVGEGIHVADDLVILEPADVDGNVVPFGQPADRMLLTNPFNLAQPLFRYDLADAVTITDEPCPCGCAHRRITSVDGRIDGAFHYENGASVPRAQALRKELIGVLHRHGGPEFDVSVEEADSVDRLWSGKSKQFDTTVI